MEDLIVSWASGAGAFGAVIVAIYLLAPKVTRWMEIIAADRKGAREAAAAPVSELVSVHREQRSEWDRQLRGIIKRLERAEQGERECLERQSALEERIADLERRT